MSTRVFWICLAVAPFAGCGTGDDAKDYSTSKMPDGSIVIAVTMGSSQTEPNKGVSSEPQDRIEAAAARECDGAYKILSAKSTVNLNQAPTYTATRSAIVRCDKPVQP